ncbi:hypothetical protein DSUL_50336 [Desulfovibrionales bacterium]
MQRNALAGRNTYDRSLLFSAQHKHENNTANSTIAYLDRCSRPTVALMMASLSVSRLINFKRAHHTHALNYLSRRTPPLKRYTVRGAC